MDLAFRISPDNILKDWGYVEDWVNGDSAAPTNWAMSGTAGSVAKESSTIKRGINSMKIISGSSGSYKATTLLENYSIYAGRTIKFGMWIKTDTASKARIFIEDGVSTTNSSYHTGGNTWEFIEVEAQIDENNTELTFGAEVQNNAITAYFDGGIAVQGDTIFTEFRDEDNGVYTKEDEWIPKVTFSTAKFEIPRKRGSVVTETKIKEKRIKIRCQVHNSVLATARTTFDNILKSSVEGLKNLYLTDDRYSKVYLNSFSNLNYLANLRVYQFSLDFIAKDPVENYISKTRKQQAISSSPTSFNLEYSGSVKSFPIIIILPTGTTLTTATLENLTTGERLSYIADVGVGITLMLDLENLAVTVDGVDSLTNFSGDFLSLVPGTNYLKYTGDDCTLNVDWFNQWVV